ncbi:MAG TPA: Hsp20/alpha crystallin family protein [Blastocatellia bacterium]|nr:Hsp20/alpha crystallin family protein [Blastocatellia bacterium]
MSSSRIAIKTQPEEPETGHSVIEREGSVFDRMRDVSQTIARRAYELFENHGKQAGRALDDWLRAELDILKSCPVEIKDTGENLVVRAEVPGFSSNEIEVSVEPRCLLISAKSSKTDEQETESVVYSERAEKDIFRSVDLPVDVDPASAKATLKHGVLEVTLTKAASSAPVQIPVQAG